MGGWALGGLASLCIHSTGYGNGTIKYEKNIVLLYRTELERKYRIVILNSTYIPEKKGGVKMSGVTGSRIGGIRAEVKVVVVEGKFPTLLEGKIGLMCDRQRWADVCPAGNMAGINTSVR